MLDVADDCRASMYDALGHRGRRRGSAARVDGHLRVQPRCADRSCSTTTSTDFGKHIIPGAIETHRVFSYVFQGYWEDIGTIRAFFEANLDLTSELPRFNFFDMSAPIFTRPRFLPARRSTARRSITRSFPTAASSTTPTSHSRSSASAASSARAARLHRDDRARQRLLRDRPRRSPRTRPRASPRIGIGTNTRDRERDHRQERAHRRQRHHHARRQARNVDHPLYYIRDGIVIIPKNGIVPHGTVI